MYRGLHRLYYGIGIVLFCLVMQVQAEEPKTPLSVAFCNYCIPFQFVNDAGEPDGMIMDYWRLWSEETGVSVAYMPASWSETIDMVRTGRADIHAGLGYGAGRDKFLHYGTALCKTDTHAFFHNEVFSPGAMADIIAFRIGVLAGDKAENFLQGNYPQAEVVAFDTYDALMAELASGRIKVFAADRLTGLHYLAQKGLLQEFSYVVDQPLYRSAWQIAGKEDGGELVNRVGKGMDKISAAQRRQINRQWTLPGYTEDADTLVIAVARNLAPFSTLGRGGEPEGFLVEFWRMWGEAVGIPVYFVFGGWAETVERVRRGEADIHSGLYKTAARDQWLAFSGPIHEVRTDLFFGSGSGDPVPAVGNSRVLFRAPVYAGMLKENADLGEIINSGLGAMPMAALIELEQRWFPDPADHYYNKAEHALALTGREKAWLSAHPRIRIAVMDAWPPMDFVDEDGKPAGIGVDHIHALNQRLGKVLEIVPGPFKDNLKKVRDRELDALLDVTPKPERSEYLEFTRAYLNIPHVIVAKKDGPYYATEADLAGKTLALEKGFFSVTYFREKYPDIRVDEYPDTAMALDAVARGRADAYAGNRSVAAWVMEQEIMSNLRIQGRLDREGSVLAIGVRKDWPELAAILDKTLASIPMDDLVSIRRKWTGMDEPEETLKVRLSPEETTWLAAREGPVVVGAETDWPPYDFTENGEVKGYSNDLLRLAAQKTGLSLEFISGYTWAQLIDKFGKGQVDIMPAIYVTPEREKSMAFTDTYAVNPSVLVSHEASTDIRGLGDLSGKRLAVPKGFSLSNHLAENHPDIRQVSVPNVLDGLKAVSLKKADGFIGSLGVISYFLKENLIPGVRIVDEVVPDRSKITDLHMAVRHETPVLRDIVQKGLDAVTDAERDALRVKWFGTTATGIGRARLRLTPGERNWLRQAGPVPMAVDPAWMPIERINPETGRHEGIAGDYINLVSKITGVTFKLVTTTSWSESMDLAKAGDIHMLAACSKTRERENFLDFTLPFLELSNAVVMLSDAPFLNDIDELAGKKVGVSEGTSIHRYLKENHPDLVLVPNKGSLKGLKMVADGRVDAYVDTLEVLGYLINTHGLFNLKVALRLPKKRELRMALKKGMAPELLSILNKAIESVRPEEKNGFYRRWISLHVEEKIDYTLLWKIGLPVAGVILLIITIISFWNRKLRKEILFRKKVEAKLSDALDVITSSIRYASRIQRSVLPPDEMMDALLPNHFVLWKPRDVVGGDIYWAAQWGNGTLVLLGDCTGHGVPGAFMTLISTGALDRALLDVAEGDAAALIQRMHQLIQAALSQTSECRDDGCSDDGLELGICYLPPRGDTLTFSGAGFPLFIGENSGIRMVKGDRKGIGYRAIPGDTVWSNHCLPVTDGQVFYMSSDGIFDQVGGPKRMGFGKKRFRKLLADIRDIPISGQGEAIFKAVAEYQGRETRRDDISAIGFTVPLKD